MGQVWAGTAPSGQPVAVKWLRSAGGDRAGLQRELATLARLDHPHVAAILDHGILGPDDDVPVARLGTPWLALERLDADLLARPPRSWAALRAVLLGMADGLAHAHARGVLHLDLKPANVMWAGPVPRLVDFGIADRLGSAEPGRIRGSPGFMAPEQLVGGAPDVRTDLFGVGATAWALLTGVGPYETASFAATRDAAAAGVPHPLPTWLPAPLASVLHGLVAEPARRPVFAADLAAALRALAWPEGPLPTRALPSRPPTAATVDWDRPLGDEDAATVEVAPPPSVVPPAPFPEDWRGPEPTLTPRHGAGLALLGLRAGPMVGREAERTQLWARLRQVAQTGRSAVVRIDGPPGSGVDRLIDWLAERVHETGAAWVSGPGVRVGQLEGRDRPTVWIGGSPDALRLVEAARPLPVLLVLRRDEHADRGAETLALGPLALPEVRLLVANTLTHHEELVTAVAETSLGMPGFAVELLEHWARIGALRIEQGRFDLAADAPPVPPGWAALRREAVERAIGQGEGLRWALDLVSAWPGPAPEAELAAALARVGGTAEGLARAAASGLLVADGGAWRPASPDVVAAVRASDGGEARRAAGLRAVAAASGDPATRGRAWRRLGDLERAAGELPDGPELAEVLEALGRAPHDPRWVTSQLSEAQAAFVRGDAARMAGLVASIPDPPPESSRATWLAVRSNLAALRGDSVAWHTLAQEALGAGPDDPLVHIAWSREAATRHDPAALEQILAFAAASPRTATLLRIAARAAANSGQRGRGLALLDGVEARDPGNTHTVFLRAITELVVQPPSRSLAAFAAAGDRFRDDGNVFGVLATLEWRIDILLDEDRTEDARALLQEAERVAAEFGIGRVALGQFRSELDEARPDPGAVAGLLDDLPYAENERSPRPYVVLASRVAATHPDLYDRVLDFAIAWDTRSGHPRLARWLALRAAREGR